MHLHLQISAPSFHQVLLSQIISISFAFSIFLIQQILGIQPVHAIKNMQLHISKLQFIHFLLILYLIIKPEDILYTVLRKLSI